MPGRAQLEQRNGKTLAIVEKGGKDVGPQEGQAPGCLQSQGYNSNTTFFLSKVQQHKK
jgi:hypothetical protein